jgi:hypothetical protein
MKRILLPVLAVAALLVPAAATAGSRHYTGPDEAGGTVDFNRVVNDGHKKVKNFIFDGIPADCDAGTVLFNNATAPLPAMKIKDGSFHGAFTNNHGGYIIVNGTFSHKNKRADGTLRLYGDLGSQTNCESGKTHWSAQRQ